MASTAPPNYYRILEVPETATTQQIRDAYKRAALQTHPDRVSAESPERPVRTRKFQLVSDAYYTLSDTTRRSEYDSQRRMFGAGHFGSDAQDPFEGETASPPPPSMAGNAFSWAWNYFSGGAGTAAADEARQREESRQFGDVFEEMLRDEGLADAETNAPTGRFWSMIGGVSGGAIGYIVANVPGMVAGVVAGNRLGAVRDTKGKSVYAVFQEMPLDQRTRLLSQLATKVFSHAVGV